VPFYPKKAAFPPDSAPFESPPGLDAPILRALVLAAVDQQQRREQQQNDAEHQQAVLGAVRADRVNDRAVFIFGKKEIML
jgi:hypothetical protein